MAIVRAAGVALRRVLTAREERADNVARTSGDYRSPRRSLPPRCRLRELADRAERAGDVRPLHPLGAIRGAYLLTAGLEPALAFVRDFRYTEEDLAYLARIKSYDPAFLDELRHFRFAGEILAMPEGTVAFADEPLLRVTAPFREALLLESGLLRAIGVSTLIATKAARLVDAAPVGRSPTGFAVPTIRTWRPARPSSAVAPAPLSGARSSICRRRHHPPCPGAGLRDRGGSLPRGGREPGSLLASARHLRRRHRCRDRRRGSPGRQSASGSRDGRGPSRQRRPSRRQQHVRRVLDEAGLHETKVLVGGDIDEFRIADLLRAGAPIAGFGVGGNLAVGLGTVASGTVGGVLGAVYKLVWYEGVGDPARINWLGEEHVAGP